jgi:ADP-ribosyl-[dinitrogen reductase] hydrolase
MQRDDSCGVCAVLPHETYQSRRYAETVGHKERVRDDRILGCLVGGAIGDAIGRLTIADQPVPANPTAESLEVGGGAQLALFTAEGMVRMLVRFHARGIGPAFAVIKHAYDRWLFTQGNTADADAARTRWAGGSADGWPDGWLVRRHELHHRRSDMGTTVTALRRSNISELGQDRRVHPRPNTSTGAGGVVRAAPGGLLVGEEFAFEIGVRIAAFTHGHPDALLSAGIVTALVCRMLQGASLEDAIAGMRGDLLNWPGSTPFYRILDVIAADHARSTETSRSVQALVHGAIAARDHRDPVSAVRSAAVSGGSAAAVVAGQLSGVLHGATAWSEAWRQATEVANVAQELSAAVSVAHRAWVMGRDIPGARFEAQGMFEEHPVSMLLWPRYPGW